MTDLRMETGNRQAFTAATPDFARRKELRAGRRTFRSWPLLPVPPGALSGAGRAAADIDWPKGAAIAGAEEWQDKADRRDLGKDFKPASDERPWLETAGMALPQSRSRVLRLCLLASVALHLSFATFLLVVPSSETIDIAGGGEVTVMLVGQQAYDSMAAGKPDAPEEQTPVETLDAVESEEAPSEATTTDEVQPDIQNEPAVPQSLTETQPAQVQPAEEMAPAPATPHTVQPAVTEAPVSANESVAVNPEIRSETGELTPESPTPLAAEAPPERPAEPVVAKAVEKVEPTQEMQPLPEPIKETVEAKPEVAKRVEKAAPKAKPVKKAKAAEKNQEARARKPAHARGEAGNSSANAQRGASENASRSPSSEPGNAAVSSYPGKVAAKLRRALKYPRSAVSGSRSGEAQVAFTVLADGTATSIRLVSSSGSPVLDQAALDAVRRASPFPPIPDTRRQWPFAVPVLFRR